jgi:hypothetical protein
MKSLMQKLIWGILILLSKIPFIGKYIKKAVGDT